MKETLNMIQTFVKDESGVTAIEYALIASLIAIGIIAAVTIIGGVLNTTFQRIATALENEPV
ncbi:Flp family type IVb pilin [Desulfotalea psychrophila]|uniref:Related to pilus assembly protein pilin subunit n=1 Tax=Desulfotalea psychrophila (strain LSv54 / DSM 12343) TaxID=177439 RepID=Q6AN06_DESPS|nr:Flp family type IVb pilin [Desulfotalea psychrophila]CAG36268.1 related to pilus assembly protein pilin subunit [Desulfotalea psychrophila LSv54]